MDRIGVRELRQNASVYLERVKAGESIEVTQHGVPIAVLGPMPQSSVIDRLVAEGKATRSRGTLADWLRENPLGEPLTDGPTLGDVLQQLRDEEYR